MIFPRRRAPRIRTRLIAGAAVLGLALFGTGASALAQPARTPPSVAASDGAITEVGRIPSSDQVNIQGQVAEIFGRHFILQDATGRVLVQIGPTREDGPLVRLGETVTVEGHIGNGEVHACKITFADGRVVKVLPPPPPPVPPVPPTPPAPPAPVGGGPAPPPPPPVPPVPPVPPLPPFGCDEG